MKTFVSIICSILILSLINTTNIIQFRYNEDSLIYASQDSSILDKESYSSDSYRQISYDRYIEQFSGAKTPDDIIIIEGADYSEYGDTEISVLQEYMGAKGDILKISDEGFVQWEFYIENEGLYNIAIEYLPIEGKNSAIERELWIDGEIPFENSRSIVFQRNWTNEGPVRSDSQGNEFRPVQIEAPMWNEALASSVIGFQDDFFKYYLTKGKHTLRLVGIKEPIAIRQIKIFNKPEIDLYKEVYKKYISENFNIVTENIDPIKIQGQDALYKSDSTLYPVADHSSPLTQPSSYSNIKLNTIGNYNWRYPKQYLTWEFEVEEEGLYKIALRVKQDFKSGSYASRRLYVNNEIPFKEAESIRINFDPKWQMVELGGEEGFLFFFEKGRNEIKFEVVMGDMAEILRGVQETIINLNALYRKIRMVTGHFPNKFRDYRLHEVIPEMNEIFMKESENLKLINKLLVDKTGKKGVESSYIERLSVQLDLFLRYPDTIPESMGDFNGNISALADWILTTSEQPLTIDYILIAPTEQQLPKANANILENILFEVRKFISTFFNDYNYIGDFADSDSNIPQREVTLWLGSVQGAAVGTGGGRDQAQVLKNLIDNYFTPESGIRVNLRLVDMNILLRAVATNNGPDLSIFEPQAQPVNYALRNAVVNLMEFEDIDEVLERFDDSAIEPFKIGEKLYALPEQQWFNMLFYRKDILHDLNLDIPQTWDELYSIIPTLQNNFLEIGLPTPVDTMIGGIPNPLFVALLYQNDASLYNEDKSRSVLDTNKAIDAFITWTEFYTKYKTPEQINELTRFRMGEAPIIIAPYTFYNRLSIAAPEIRGLWGMAPIPGVRQSDGTIRRDQGTTVYGTVMYRNANDKNATWDFMKWWTSSETQVGYGNDMESLQGPSARWPTANIEAMLQLPWPSADAASIAEQWKWVKAIPEVPGGYYTGRYIDNAVRLVLNEGEDPREIMLDFVEIINDEIILKRKEFGME